MAGSEPQDGQGSPPVEPEGSPPANPHPAPDAPAKEAAAAESAVAQDAAGGAVGTKKRSRARSRTWWGWKHFSSHPTKTGHSICSICNSHGVVVSFKTSNTRAAAANHLERMHKDVRPGDQSTIEDGFKKQSLPEKRQQALEMKMARAWVSAGIAFNAADNPDLREFIGDLNMAFRSPKADTLTKLADQVCARTRVGSPQRLIMTRGLVLRCSYNCDRLWSLILRSHRSSASPPTPPRQLPATSSSPSPATALPPHGR
jgi:hypothetical protein